MKKLIFILPLLFIFSCASYKAKKKKKEIDEEMTLTQEELERYRSSNDTIYYDNKAKAYVSNIEWEYLPGDELRMEISVTLINKFGDSDVHGIIKYIHHKHDDAKVELNYD